MTERSTPLTPTVLFVGTKRRCWRMPAIYRLTAKYETPTTVACDFVKDPAKGDGELLPVAGRKVLVRQQTHIYPIRDDANWAQVEAQHAVLQATLDAFAEGLRALGSYEKQLAAAGGMKGALNPLTPTIIQCSDPDRDEETS